MKHFLRINRLVSFLYFLFKYRDFKAASLFSKHNVIFKAASKVKRMGNKFVFTRTGNVVSIQSTYVYGHYLPSLIAVLNDKQVKVISEDATGIVLRVNDILVNVHSGVNIVTAYEIFLAKLYNVSIPYANVIMDIGMNVGYATLFFASLEKTVQVYSYEPFLGTFKEAINNINLNPQLKRKIKPFDYGISSRSQVVEVPMFDSGANKASTSKFVLDSRENAQVVKRINVEVKDIIEVLNEIMERHPQEKLFLKIDCEGEEYDIIDRLNNAGMMQKIAGFLIEWHIKGPDAIMSTLHANGFVSLHLPKVGGTIGMIYSFK